MAILLCAAAVGCEGAARGSTARARGTGPPNRRCGSVLAPAAERQVMQRGLRQGQGRGAALLHLFSRCFSSRVVAPADRSLCQAQLRERERLGQVVWVNPAHDAQQGCLLPPHVEHPPEAVRLARRPQQEVMRGPFRRLIEVQQGQRRQRWWGLVRELTTATSGYTCGLGDVARHNASVRVGPDA